MAKRVKPQSTSPNKVLVIFLVLFILSTLGFGIWVYTLVKDRDKWDGAARAKTEELKSNKQTLDWYKFRANELSAAIGDPDFSKRPEEMKTWKENREYFLTQKNFTNEEGDKEFRDFMKNTLEKRLGEYNDGYKNKFADLVDQLQTKLTKAQQDYALEAKRNNDQQQELNALQKKYAAEREAILKEIKDSNQKIVDARMKSSEAMTATLKQNDALQKALDEKQAEFASELTKKSALITGLEAQLKSPIALAKGGPAKGAAEPQAMMLDISSGKPLWDTPRGKIIRVDDPYKKVFINKGASDGAKPGLTFAVFTGGSAGRGEGNLKATIEVVRVVDANSSLCKVNTLYDAKGREVPVLESTPGRLIQEGGTPLKEGDLIFNLFWGSHVALVGVFDAPGSAPKSPAAQMDDLNDFMRRLERMGVTVDAYTDLRDGKLIGEPTPQTNFVIRGNPAKKLPEAPDDNRVKGINDVLASMRELAAERGLIVVSPENFAVLTGLRRMGSDGTLQTMPFVPSRTTTTPVREVTPPPDQQKKGS
jgi:hypothetical protein